MSHDHGSPIPPNEKVLKDTHEPVADHEHDYTVADHTHDHTGLRRFLPLVGYLFLMAIVGWQFAEQQQTVDEVRRVSAENRNLLEQSKATDKQVAALALSNRVKAYQDCVTRNERAETSLREFRRLESIAKKDGNPAEAAFWHGYVVKLTKDKLPPCGKHPDPEKAKKEMKKK